ncbi:TrmH family RNA methyltransferase [Pseudenhygromyxa sp. WMMC2535]|uniref:TrmH family RNA methyltransferase n=1 Tax=Pseudenhygromyxa sp. WMMC2535 TaxID=2712867 RepID=UPI001C3E1E5C
MRYQPRLCSSAACGLRFPVAEGSELGASCPLCGAPTHFVGEPYETHEIRSTRVPSGPPIQALLDNVRSLQNVGSIFRAADGAGVEHLHLGGFTPTPDHPKLVKTALGAEASVAWTRHADPLAAATELAAAGLRLWAIEGGPGSRDIFELLADVGGPQDPGIVLVLGHEVSGVDPRILALCERIARIPMAGTKGSLNVSVAFGVAAYLLRHGPGVVVT